MSYSMNSIQVKVVDLSVSFESSLPILNNSKEASSPVYIGAIIIYVFAEPFYWYALSELRSFSVLYYVTFRQIPA